jgi:virginiamycin B lyase
MKVRGIIATAAAILLAPLASAQSPNNAVWGINDHNEVFRYNPFQDTFERMPGTLKQVSVGIDGEVWGVGPNDDPFRWTGSQWQSIQGKLKQLSVRNAKEAWGVNAANDLFRWNGSTWEPLGNGSHFVSAGVDGTVWGLSLTTPVVIQTLDVFYKSHTLIAQYGLDRPFNQISVTDLNRVWAIDDVGGSFRGGDQMEWKPFDIALFDVAESANGELWRVAKNGLLHFQQTQTAPLKNYPNLDFRHIAVGLAGLTDDERQQILEAHNSERQKYPGVGPLQWSRELEGFAQDWAQQVASGEKSGHRPASERQNNPFRPGELVGENMYVQWPANGVTGVNAVTWFISEKQYYHYDQDDGNGALGEPPGCTAPPGSACGHFTQVIWKDTQYVGCGTATETSSRNGKWYVCNYYPAGNSNNKPY